MSFPPSLHPLSVAAGVLASAQRTPRKSAIVCDGETLDYATLRARIADRARAWRARGIDGPQIVRPDAPDQPVSLVIDIVAAAKAGVCLDLTGSATRIDSPDPASSEDAPVVVVAPACVFSHRTIVLRLLNTAVTHAAFSRDTISALALPPDSASGVIAAIAPLWLGGTLNLLQAGDARALVQLIASGAVNQAWFGPREIDAFDKLPEPLPAPSPGFRTALLTALPHGAARDRWLAWLGPSRVTAEIGDAHLGPVVRHAGLALAPEPYVGVMLGDAAETRIASGLATTPPTPAWREVLS